MNWILEHIASNILFISIPFSIFNTKKNKNKKNPNAKSITASLSSLKQNKKIKLFHTDR